MIKEITVKIKDVDFKVKKCVAALMFFEDMTGVNAFLLDGNFSNAVNMFYSMLKVNNKNFNYSIDEFKALLDEDETLLTAYINYILDLKKSNDNDVVDDEKKN